MFSANGHVGQDNCLDRSLNGHLGNYLRCSFVTIIDGLDACVGDESINGYLLLS